MYSESYCFLTVPLWPVYKVKLGQDNPLLKPFNASQSKYHGLTISKYALCNLISATHFLSTPLYLFLNITGKSQPQSLAIPVSYFLCMECSILIFFFGLPSDFCSHDIFSLASVIILYSCIESHTLSSIYKHTNTRHILGPSLNFLQSTHDHYIVYCLSSPTRI